MKKWRQMPQKKVKGYVHVWKMLSSCHTIIIVLYGIYMTGFIDKLEKQGLFQKNNISITANGFLLTMNNYKQ